MTISAYVFITLREYLLNSSKIIFEESVIDFKKAVQSFEGVDSIFIVEPSNSPYNAIAKVSTSSIQTLSKVILGKISKLPQVRETKTMIIIG